MGLPLPSEDDGNTDGIASHDERWECPRCSAAAPAPMQVNRQTMTLVVHVREYMNESIEKTVRPGVRFGVILTDSFLFKLKKKRACACVHTLLQMQPNHFSNSPPKCRDHSNENKAKSSVGGSIIFLTKSKLPSSKNHDTQQAPNSK